MRGQQRRMEEERWGWVEVTGKRRQGEKSRWMTEIKGERRKWGEAEVKMGRGGESLSRKLMEKREEKREKRKRRRMRVAVEGYRRREESRRSDETCRETHKWSESEREEMLFQDHTH